MFANKMDKDTGNQSLQDIISNLDLNEISDREWNIQGSECIKGVGINKGFDWISKILFQQKGYFFINNKYFLIEKCNFNLTLSQKL